MDIQDELAELAAALETIADGLDVQPGRGGDAVRLVARRLVELAKVEMPISVGGD